MVSRRQTDLFYRSLRKIHGPILNSAMVHRDERLPIGGIEYGNCIERELARFQWSDRDERPTFAEATARQA